MKLKTPETAPKMKNGVVEKPKKSKKIEKAEEAVSKFEEMREEYRRAQDTFKTTYPKAWADLQQIKHIEDEVREQAEACKLLVRDAGQTVGEFLLTPRAKSEGYDGEKLLRYLNTLPEPDFIHLFKELVERGFIKCLDVDKAAAQVVRASDPELRAILEPAWDTGGQPLTSAVTVPKI